MSHLKRALPVAAVLALLAVAVTTAGGAVAHAARRHPVRLQVRRTSLGSVLVVRGGLVVYAFTRDRGRHDSCVSVSGCAGVWPPLWTSGAPRAGREVRGSLLGTIRVLGRRQVTYAGHPLYGYAGARRGSTAYVGVSSFGGTWKAVTPDGRLVTARQAAW